jgi:WD repeat-containing protein 42A
LSKANILLAFFNLKAFFVFQVVVRLPRQSFFSICFDPTAPQTFAASCGNHFVRLYDLRMPGRPYDAGTALSNGCLKMWTDPTLLQNGRLRPDEMKRSSRRHVTDVRFGRTGNLLVNFAGNDVVLFEGDDPDKMEGIVCTKVIQRYTGRDNEQTFLKEVRFVGEEQFVMTGSDSGELFIWHTDSGELVHRVTCDKVVLNGIEPNPMVKKDTQSKRFVF